MAQPFITGPDAYSRLSNEPPILRIEFEENLWYGVELTTDARFFRSTDGRERRDENFYASWTEGLKGPTRFTSYHLPLNVWLRFRDAARIYYRVITSSRSDAWINAQPSLKDADWERAPSILLSSNRG